MYEDRVLALTKSAWSRTLLLLQPNVEPVGRSDKGPPGTYYRNKSDPNAQFWHMIDQVLLRPDAIDLVDIQSLAIVTRADGIELAGPNGRPDRSYSDHLPIFIETRDLPHERGS